MSESSATFTSPTSATTGLQGYDLDRRLKNLAPTTLNRLAAGTTARRLKRHRPNRGLTAHEKDRHVMKHFPQMVETLHKSIADIISAAPENRDELVATSFAEFEAAFAPELAKAMNEETEEVLAKHTEETEEALAKFVDDNEVEAPLFKGLGTVGAVANLVAMIANAANRIIEGKSYNDEDNDPASDEVTTLLEHLVEVGELALRAAVNEHVDIAGDDDDVEDGLSYVRVPSAEDPDTHLVIKTVLPMDLAKFACDPASITISAVELGSGLLLDAGIAEETLGKLFEVNGDVLEKMDAPDMLAEPGGPAPDDLVGQLEIAGRIMAAGLMQVDHLMELASKMGMGGSPGGYDGVVGQGGEEQEPDEGDEQEPDEGDEPEGDEGDEEEPDEGDVPRKKRFGKAAQTDDLAKVGGEMDLLRKTVGDLMEKLAQPNAEVELLRKKVENLSAQPAPARGVLRSTGLSKVADGGGSSEDQALEKLASELDACRTDERRTEVLLKAAIKFPGVDLSSLRKVD